MGGSMKRRSHLPSTHPWRRLLLWTLATLWCALAMQPPHVGWCSRPPSRLGYAFFQGRDPGRIPGHAYLVFPQPLPRGYRLVGGGYQFYYCQGDEARFLIDHWPWRYRLIWRCPPPEPLP